MNKEQNSITKYPKNFLIYIIIFYQKILSPDQGAIFKFLGLKKKICIYYPTCSEYAKQAIEKHGIRKGLSLTTRRIGRCNPFHEPGVDLVPESHENIKPREH